MVNISPISATTIIGIRKKNQVVVAGDGQASMGNTIMKANVKKVRRLGSNNSVALSRLNAAYCSSTLSLQTDLYSQGPYSNALPF